MAKPSCHCPVENSSSAAATSMWMSAVNNRLFNDTACVTREAIDPQHNSCSIPMHEPTSVFLRVDDISLHLLSIPASSPELPRQMDSRKPNSVSKRADTGVRTLPNSA